MSILPQLNKNVPKLVQSVEIEFVVVVVVVVVVSALNTIDGRFVSF